MSTILRRTTALIVGVLALATLSNVPASASTPAVTYQSKAFQATNQVRVERDRVRLKRNACLKRYAVRQASRMARRDHGLWHQSMRPIARVCGMRMVGENVAYGYRSGTSVVVSGWMHSAGHRANILNGRYRQMAIGARRGDSGLWYAAQVFGRRA